MGNLKEVLLRVAEDPKPGEISSERLEAYLSKISGRVVDGKMMTKRINPETGKLEFQLVNVS